MTASVHLASGDGPPYHLPQVGDRRSSFRHAAHSMALLATQGEFATERCWLVNISAGGVALELGRGADLPMGRSVVVELPLGCSLSRIRTRCRVVGRSGAHREVLHLAFVDGSEVFQRALAATVAEWEQRSVEGLGPAANETR